MPIASGGVAKKRTFFVRSYDARLPHGKQNRSDFLKAKANRLRAPRIHFSHYRPLIDLMVAGVGKHRDGHSKLK